MNQYLFEKILRYIYIYKAVTHFMLYYVTDTQRSGPKHKPIKKKEGSNQCKGIACMIA